MPTTFRVEIEPVDVTPDPRSPHADGYRHFAPGPRHYFIDDKEVTEDEFMEAAQKAGWLPPDDPFREHADGSFMDLTAPETPD